MYYFRGDLRLAKLHAVRFLGFSNSFFTVNRVDPGSCQCNKCHFARLNRCANCQASLPWFFGGGWGREVVYSGETTFSERFRFGEMLGSKRCPFGSSIVRSHWQSP